MGTHTSWLGIKGAAKQLGVSEAEVLKMIQNGQLVTQKNGNVTEVGFIKTTTGNKVTYAPMPVQPPAPPPPSPPATS